MKFKVFIVSILIVCSLLPGLSFAQNKVVVIPLLETPTGPPAPVPKTGQTRSYGTGDDGQYEAGIASPNPRFVDHGDGAVVDKLTGLIWLGNGNCSLFYENDPIGGNSRSWRAALYACNRLASGYCGLTDGSQTGDWRLPNLKELDSLIDLGRKNPALPPDWPLTAVTQSSYYWSSTTVWDNTDSTWDVNFSNGLNSLYGKDYDNYVRCVR